MKDAFELAHEAARTLSFLIQMTGGRPDCKVTVSFDDSATLSHVRTAVLASPMAPQIMQASRLSGMAFELAGVGFDVKSEKPFIL